MYMLNSLLLLRWNLTGGKCTLKLMYSSQQRLNLLNKLIMTNCVIWIFRERLSEGICHQRSILRHKFRYRWGNVLPIAMIFYLTRINQLNCRRAFDSYLWEFILYRMGALKQLIWVNFVWTLALLPHQQRLDIKGGDITVSYPRRQHFKVLRFTPNRTVLVVRMVISTNCLS